jgi:hypothetical protein
MAVRYPLVIDATDNNKIKELPANDSLNLSTNSIVNAVNITASGTLTVGSLVVDSSNVNINGIDLATVAITNSYTDLDNRPTLFDGQYSSLTGRYEPGNLADVSIDLTSQSISELSDVVTTSTAANQVLKWNGAAFVNSNVDFTELTGTSSIVSQGDTFTGLVVGDVTGSVLAADSTIIVDGTNGTIPGYISIASLKSIVAGAASYGDFQTAIAAL